MTDEMERRLRSALTARAGQITPDRLRFEPPPTAAAHPRRFAFPLRRWLPATAGAAIAAVVLGFTLHSGPPPAQPIQPAGPSPAATPSATPARNPSTSPAASPLVPSATAPDVPPETVAGSPGVAPRTADGSPGASASPKAAAGPPAVSRTTPVPSAATKSTATNPAATPPG